MRSLQVELGDRSYPIHIGSGLLADPFWTETIRGRQVLVVSDAHVAPLYLAPLRAALTGRTLAECVLPAGEASKSLDNLGRILEALATLRASRDCAVIALGGGVVGDIAGFAAASWMRGVDFIQIPTTLLAQVDSSVGGKTAINLPQGKNLVGAFHQPRAVVADLATLDTLAPRELSAGLAEVAKYGAIADAAFLDWIGEHAHGLNNTDANALAVAVEHCCAMKAAIVRRDERETGERALLNFGHTFGHALEAEAGYGELLHGEAVAIGMVLAARLSARLGHASAEAADTLETLLSRLRLPTRIPQAIAREALPGHMRLDKKAVSGALRFILWRGPGRAFIADGVPEDAVNAVLREG